MSTMEFYTLIFGISVISFLVFLNYYYKYKKNKIIRFIVRGSKQIKRMHYILKSNHYRIIDVDKNFSFTILYGTRYLKNQFPVKAVAQKENKKYLCFPDISVLQETKINYEVLFQCAVSRYYNCLIIDTKTFSVQPLIIYNKT